MWYREGEDPGCGVDKGLGHALLYGHAEQARVVLASLAVSGHAVRWSCKTGNGVELRVVQAL